MKMYAGMPGIRARRRSLGMKVAEAAGRLGVTVQNWYDWEKGKYTPTAALLPALAELLQCRLEDLYRDDDGEEARE